MFPMCFPIVSHSVLKKKKTHLPYILDEFFGQRHFIFQLVSDTFFQNESREKLFYNAPAS